MRLIDADALVREISVLHTMTDDYGIKTGYEFCMRLVEDAPTIEPDRKTGRWIPVMNGRGGHCCNRCNGYAPSYMNGDEHLSDFCPYCGADMRGGEDD